MPAETRLATYGTLSPGKPNHDQLSDLRGRWSTGCVRGALVEAGWGAALGFPAFVPDEGGSPINVDLFESDDLPAHWPRLDRFEGEGYRRVVVQVETDDGQRAAFMYVAADHQ